MSILEAQDQIWLENVIGKIKTKMDWVSEKSKHKIPFTTINGTHDNRIVDNPTGTETDGINWWTNGFGAA